MISKAQLYSHNLHFDEIEGSFKISGRGGPVGLLGSSVRNRVPLVKIFNFFGKVVMSSNAESK